MPSICFAPPCSANFDAEVEKGYVFRADTVEELAEQIGADGFSKDAVEAVELAKSLLK